MSDSQGVFDNDVQSQWPTEGYGIIGRVSVPTGRVGDPIYRVHRLGEYTLDQIADYLAYGYWGGTPHPFATAEISFNVTALSEPEATLARLALQAWDDVGSFSFVETFETAQITFDDLGTHTAHTRADGTVAQISISADWNGGDTSLYSYTFQAYIHEIGHALGLGHAGPYNGSARYGSSNLYRNDSWANSVMSYFDQATAGAGTRDYFVTPQLADLLAIATLYGLDNTTRAADTVYGFHTNAGVRYDFADPVYLGLAPALTIFDTGGIDTLDASGFVVDQWIELSPEARSDVGGARNNIAIARGTIIENAIGGAGNDTIIGNEAANELTGGAGDDTL
jgi:serralysin